MSELAPKFDTPHILSEPHKTYLGHDKKMVDEINNNGATKLGDNTFTKHINTPGATVPDERYVGNKKLDDARSNALQQTMEIAKAEGGKLADGIKESYAAAMAHLRNTHIEITPSIMDQNSRIRNDVEKIAEITAHKLGKKVTVVAGFLISSASFAGETIDVGGQIVSGKDINTQRLKAAGEEVVSKGVEGTMGIIDPLGAIDTKGMTTQLLNGNIAGIGTEFNNERLATAAKVTEFAEEYSR